MTSASLVRHARRVWRVSSGGQWASGVHSVRLSAVRLNAVRLRQVSLRAVRLGAASSSQFPDALDGPPSGVPDSAVTVQAEAAPGKVREALLEEQRQLLLLQLPPVDEHIGSAVGAVGRGQRRAEFLQARLEKRRSTTKGGGDEYGGQEENNTERDIVRVLEV